MNKTSQYEMTIVVPVYNETDNMERVEKEFSDYLKEAPISTCVLFVNDGSKDDSLDKIRDICSRCPDFYYISSSVNHGVSTAMKAGIDTVESRLMGYIDSDLQTTPHDFPLLLKHADTHQIVSGIRANRKDSWFKNTQSRIANSFRRFMTGDTATDSVCPLKVMWTDYAKRVPFFEGMHRFMPALMMLEDGKFYEVPVRHFPRIAGVSKYGLWNRLAGPFFACFAYRWMRAKYIRYNIDNTNVK